MFKVIISAIVALGFSAAYAQEGSEPAKMDSAPAAAAPAEGTPAADKPAKKAKHKHGKKKKDAEEAPKAE